MLRHFIPERAFKEAYTCWSHLGYISNFNYVVDRAADFELPPGRGGSWANVAESGQYKSRSRCASGPCCERVSVKQQRRHLE